MTCLLPSFLSFFFPVAPACTCCYLCGGCVAGRGEPAGPPARLILSSSSCLSAWALGVPVGSFRSIITIILPACLLATPLLRLCCLLFLLANCCHYACCCCRWLAVVVRSVPLYTLVVPVSFSRRLAGRKMRGEEDLKMADGEVDGREGEGNDGGFVRPSVVHAWVGGRIGVLHTHSHSCTYSKLSWRLLML